MANRFNNRVSEAGLLKGNLATKGVKSLVATILNGVFKNTFFEV